jgi:ankyrin repeat protein
MAAATELFEAIRAADAGKVRELIAAQPAVVNARNLQGQSAVLMACYMGQNEIRDLLIDKGAALELHEAAAAGNLQRVKESVEGKLQLANNYSPDGFPLIALAAAFGHQDIVHYLHAKGADLNSIATNGTGYTALTGAVANGHASLVNWLAQNGADVNYRYGKGHSSLLVAAANGRLDIVKTLVEHGADSHARTDDGKSAMDFATKHSHKDVTDYLHSLGSTIHSA